MSLPNGIFYNKGAITMADLKKAMALVAACVFLTACGAKAETTTDPYEGVTPDFRNVNWGMSVDEVKAREESEPSKDENGILKYVNQSVIGLDCSLEYQFYTENNTLNGAEYRINIDKLSHKEIHDSFVKLYNQLSEKYGEPTDLKFSVQDTKDNFYFNITDEVPADMEYKSAVYSAKWDKSDISITLRTEFSGASPQWIELKYRVELPAEVDENI